MVAKQTVGRIFDPTINSVNEKAAPDLLGVLHSTLSRFTYTAYELIHTMSFVSWAYLTSVST